jgi:hypothetical protein
MILREHRGSACSEWRVIGPSRLMTRRDKWTCGCGGDFAPAITDFTGVISPNAVSG